MQLLSQDIQSVVRFMKLSADGSVLLVVMLDHTMLLLWHDETQVSAVEPMDAITAMAYDAMMLEPDIPYNPLQGDSCPGMLTPHRRVPLESTHQNHPST